MQKLIITGVDRVVGANLAAVLSGDFAVTAVSPIQSTVAGCHSVACDLEATLSVQQMIATSEADVIVHCGAFAESSWMDCDFAGEKRIVTNLRAAAEKFDAKLVLVSTDGIYRGPWLFHPENSECTASSRFAKQAAICEAIVSELESSLVLRTHVIGWAPDGSGVLETMLDQLEEGTEFRFGHYATPIGASRFASVVRSALACDLTGTFNVGGAERTSPYGFGCALSTGFDLASPDSVESDTHDETSLSCTEIRQALGIAMPTLSETVDELVLEFDERIAAFEGHGVLAAAA